MSPKGAKTKKKKAVKRRPMRRGYRTKETLDRDRQQIGLLYFIQCWKPPEIAKKLKLSVRTIERDISALRKEFKGLFEKAKGEYLQNILAGVQERCSERIKKLWNEYIELSTKIENQEKRKRGSSPKALNLRRMRLKVLDIIRREDNGLVDRLQKLGILESDDHDFSDEITVYAEIKRKYKKHNQPDHDGDDDVGDNC